jgi:hypothetical protein
MKRITLRLPDPAMTTLEERATKTGEPTASLAANLLRTALYNPQLPARAPTPTPPAPGPPPDQRPPWIPQPENPTWHKDIWQAITALHQRYPRALKRLEEDWWQHPERVETLAALATWRARIDTNAQDPREEISFHNALERLTTTLNQTPGSKPHFQPREHAPPKWG